MSERLAGIITGGKDRNGNYKVRPFGGGRTVILVSSAIQKYNKGTRIEYDVSRTGDFVDFANEYHEAGKQQKCQRRAEPSPNPATPTLDLILEDQAYPEALILGQWRDARDVISEIDGIKTGEFGTRKYIEVDKLYINPQQLTERYGGKAVKRAVPS